MDITNVDSTNLFNNDGTAPPKKRLKVSQCTEPSESIADLSSLPVCL